MNFPPRKSSGILKSPSPSSLSHLDHPSHKTPHIPTLVELSKKYLPKEIPKEKEIEFNDRKINLEKKALIEERERIEKEKESKFNERDYEWGGEEKIEESMPPKYELWNHDNISCKSGRGIAETLKIKGWANLPSDFRLYFKIKDEEPPIIKEKYTYLNFQRSKLKKPNLYKLTKKMKLQTLTAINPNYYQIDAENLITIVEINKRADIFAKLFMKFNLEETLEKQNKEEEEKMKKEEEEKTIQEEVLLNIELDNQDKRKNSMSISCGKIHKDTDNEQETNQSLKIIDEDEEDSEAEIKEKKKEEELSPKKMNDLLLKKRLEVATNMTIAEMKKIAEINKNYQEIIEYFDEKVLHLFQTDNYEECIFYKEKKEEFVGNIVHHMDYDSLLRTLIIYKLNNNII